MKRICFVLCFVCFISFSMGAPLLNFQDENIQPGETILATIITPGEFVEEIVDSDISFYEGRKKVSFDYDVIFYENVHYLYIYANREGNFSVKVSNVLYKEAGVLGSVDLVKLFGVSKNVLFDDETNNSYVEILSIRPGFVFSTSKIPNIKLVNVGNVTLNLSYGENKTSIAPFGTVDVEFMPEDVFSYFDVSSYKDFSVPVIYTALVKVVVNESNKSVVNESNKSVVERGMRVRNESLKFELFSGNVSYFNIELFNYAEEDLTNISAISDINFIGVGNVDGIRGKGVLNLTLNFTPEFAGYYDGGLNITYNQSGIENFLWINLSVFVLESGAPVAQFVVLEESCSTKTGVVCDRNSEICNGTVIFTKDKNVTESCCLGNCVDREEEKDSGSYGWLVALVIFAILGIGGYYLYDKQRKLMPAKPEDMMRDTTEKFERRLAGQPSSRISGGVSKT